jgi:macrolide-specific efflux system membrane fusion protein
MLEHLQRTARRPFVVMPVVAVLALGGWLLFKPDNSSATNAPALSRTVAATVGPMATTVSAQGTVAAAHTTDLSFTSAGTVTAVNVVAGQKVTAGQVLATVDSAALQSTVAAAQADVASADATLSDHESAGASSAQLAADRSSVTSAQDRLAAAQTSLDGAQLVADFDGTVASVDLTVGEQLSSSGTGATTATGSGSGSGRTSGNLGSSSGTNGAAASTGSTGSTSTPQIQLISAGSYTVKLGVDDNDIASVKVGQTATIALSTASSTQGRGFGGFGGFGGGAFPGAATGQGGGAAGQGGTTATTQASSTVAGSSTGTGTVTEVGQIADASSGVASYPVTVAFADDTGTFNVGATVQVDITIAQVQDVVQVPTFAVATTNAGSTVTVSANGKESTRTVTTGLTSGGMTQITSGLKGGEEVVLAFPGRGGGATTGTGATRTGGGG